MGRSKYIIATCPNCGNDWRVRSDTLKNPRTKGCGCLHKNKYPNGESSWPEYRIWNAIKSRCERPSQDNYQRYGGRGITMCSRWRHSFFNFIEDMGRMPEDTSIDRIDTNGNYEPSNCRWATSRQQSMNTRQTVIPYEKFDYLMDRLKSGDRLVDIGRDMNILPKTIGSFKFRHKHLL